MYPAFMGFRGLKIFLRQIAPKRLVIQKEVLLYRSGEYGKCPMQS
jgi:hypothetical protein